ncbi:HAMP domain-containing protein [Catenulispora sp. GP43]|uniref:hypothetical protein n=1 Tax=Catenulispora sp. GP43 TaxID=3156263 RepID=UPI003513BE59
MQTQEWIGLAGVAVGGALTYLTQFSTARLTSRNEDRRRADQRAEARREEQLQLLRDFITIAQQGVRIAEQREIAADWAAAGTPEWFAAARDVIDRLFVTERMIQILFSRDLYQRAWKYATAVNRVMWRDPDEIAEGGRLWDVSDEPQTAFLNAAREAVF